MVVTANLTTREKYFYFVRERGNTALREPFGPLTGLSTVDVKVDFCCVEETQHQASSQIWTSMYKAICVHVCIYTVYI